MIGIGISLVSSLLRGGASGMIGAFVAAYKALTDEQNVDANGNIMNLMPKGVVTATSAHSTPIMAPDKDGVYQEYDADVPVYKGARVDLDPTKLFGQFTVTVGTNDPISICNIQSTDGSTHREKYTHVDNSIIIGSTLFSGANAVYNPGVGGKVDMYTGDVLTLRRFYITGAKFEGEVPDFTLCPELDYIRCASNQLTGSIPEALNNPKLIGIDYSGNHLTGNIPDLSACTVMTSWGAVNNQLTGYVGGWPNRAFAFSANSNDLTEEAVNLILTEADTYGIASGSLINLTGGTNAAPTGAGITAKNNLIANGATVTTN